MCIQFSRLAVVLTDGQHTYIKRIPRSDSLNNQRFRSQSKVSSKLAIKHFYAQQRGQGLLPSAPSCFAPRLCCRVAVFDQKIVAMEAFYIISSLLEIYKVITKSVVFAAFAGSQYRRARFGITVGDIFYYMGLVDTDQLQEIHWNINLWTDKEVLAWRDSYVASYNAVLVAGAIFANIGLSALQLKDMYTVHWSARALCIVSMILGVLSTTMATSQQYELAMLNNPTLIRLWLSRGRPNAYKIKGQVLPISHFDMRALAAGQQRRHREVPTDWREHDKYMNIEPFKGLPLESSIYSLKAIAMPRLLLKVAVLVFMVGIGLYLLFQWVDDMGSQPAANRSVFFVFVASVGIFVLYYWTIVSNMVDNQAKKFEEFDLHSLGGTHKTAALEELEKDLEEVQKRMKTLGAIERQIQGNMRTSHETGRSNSDAKETADMEIGVPPAGTMTADD